MTSLSPFSVSPQLASSDTPLVTSALPVPPPVAPSTTANKPKTKPRKRINTAEKRHQHNAVERQRRETLNTKFIDLARLLPALAAHRRPSKSAIVNGSISHLNYQRGQRLLAAKLLRGMVAERDALLGEINEWRKASGFAPRDTAPSWTEEIDEVCNVEKETFGTFLNVEGEDGEDDDNEGSTDNFSVPSQPSFATGLPTQNGLYTPRASTDVDALTQAQALFGNMPLPAIRCSTASSLGPNWSNDFAYSVSNTQNPNVFPLSQYMSDSVDHSVSDSPTTSTHGTAITPPMFTEMLQHTPSPHSSNGMPVAVEEVKPSVMQPPQQQTWTPAQLLAAHQQALLHRQQQQQQQQQAQAFVAPFTPPIGNLDPNVFTQQLMATMLANGNMNNILPAQDQIDQWRRASLVGASIPSSRGNSTSLHDIRNAVRLGMDMAQWATASDRVVEGF